jgi:hypothetical protein
MITKDAVVDYYGSPAVRSVRQKLDPDLPVTHWWITEPVAHAIAMAGQLSRHDELTFASVTGTWTGEGFASIAAIAAFINHINRWRPVSGLEEIPDGKVTPHMFRRTMAMLTRDFPGSEIAVGMQLKHVATRALANRVTGNDTDTDPSWAQHLDTAITHRRFDRLTELFNADTGGQSIGYGPGADRLREAFSTIREQAQQLRATGQARRGDIRVEPRPAPPHPNLDPLRQTQPLHHERRRPRRREIPRRRDHPGRAPRAAAGPLPARPLRQQHHCPRPPAGLERRTVLAAPASGLDSVAPNHRRRLEAELSEVDRVLKRAGR